MRGAVVAGALGNCVHVAGVVGFLRVAEQLGYETHFLGAAVAVEGFVEAIKRHDPEIVGVSYRLTPDVGARLVEQLKAELDAKGLADRKFVFGGTPPVCEQVRKLGLFGKCFDGLEAPDEVWYYLKGTASSSETISFASTQLERLEQKHPYPLLRHHFGLPDLEETIAGIGKIAESGVLDVISIAPDQNAQESFFRPQEMDPALDGAGGVPLRSEDDLDRVYQASRRGNYPLLRIYSGTRDLIQWADLATRALHNAWGAIPLCWYSALDRRSERPPEEAIKENQQCMRWYGEKDIPVEVNEPHHWSMRDAHDTMSVVMAYLSAYNARQMGVKHYIAQYMFNSPPGTYGAMDLAKILAQAEMVESLHGPDFVSMRQVRAGLLHLSPRIMQAKGQLAASTTLALALRPHIIHVVGFPEGDHAASAEEVVESCEIVHGVLRNALVGMPDMAVDLTVLQRKEMLLSEAEVLLDAIRAMGEGDLDPLTDPRVLAKAIAGGILDAPHLKGNEHALGALETRLIDGAVFAVNPVTREPLSETERLAALPEPLAALTDKGRASAR